MVWRDDSSPREEGMVPLRRLLSRYTIMSEDSMPNAEGIVPVIEFRNRYNAFKAVR